MATGMETHMAELMVSKMVLSSAAAMAVKMVETMAFVVE